MALITVLCQDREARCEQRLAAALRNGDKEREKLAIRDYERYQSLRLKMFSPI